MTYVILFPWFSSFLFGCNKIITKPEIVIVRITHDRWGSSSNPSPNGYLHSLTDMDRTLNETDTGKILQYRPDYNNRPSHAIFFMSPVTGTSGCLFVSTDTQIECTIVGYRTGIFPVFIPCHFVPVITVRVVQ